MTAVYTSVTRINSAFPMLSSVTNITSAIIDQYATDVEAEIDAKIIARYTLPLASVPPILAAISTRETIYRITVQRALIQFPPAQQGRHPLQVQHIDDQKLLDDIVNGDLSLVASGGAEIATSLAKQLIYSTTMGYVPTFSEGSQMDQVQDSDKLDDDLINRGLL